MQKYESICYDVLQHLGHSPIGRVLESFAPARGDMHSPRASVKYTPCLRVRCFTEVTPLQITNLANYLFKKK